MRIRPANGTVKKTTTISKPNHCLRIILRVFMMADKRFCVLFTVHAHDKLKKYSYKYVLI